MGLKFKIHICYFFYKCIILRLIDLCCIFKKKSNYLHEKPNFLVKQKNIYFNFVLYFYDQDRKDQANNFNQNGKPMDVFE